MKNSIDLLLDGSNSTTTATYDVKASEVFWGAVPTNISTIQVGKQERPISSGKIRQKNRRK